MDDLLSLDDALAQDHAEHERKLAIRRRFEESAQWQEHKRWHDEQGTQPRLEIWEAEQPVLQPANGPEPQAEPVRHTVKVGGCDCQPRMPFMELRDDGNVIPPSPNTEPAAMVYGAQAEISAPYGAVGTSGSVYAAPGEQKELYR